MDKTIRGEWWFEREDHGALIETDGTSPTAVLAREVMLDDPDFDELISASRHALVALRRLRETLMADVEDCAVEVAIESLQRALGKAAVEATSVGSMHAPARPR